MKSKLVRGQNLFEVSLFGIANKGYKDSQFNDILIKGKKYEIIGEYDYSGEIENCWMIKEKYSFELFHKCDFDLIENKIESVDIV